MGTVRASAAAILLILAVPSVTQIVPSAAQPQQRVDYAPAIAALERQIPDLMERAKIPGLAISLVDGDRVVWARGFGHTDRTRAVQVTANSLFLLQSISKTYTTIGVLLAIEQGWLALDDPVVRFVPTLSVHSRYGEDQVAKITIRHLLAHRAGLNHEAPLGNFSDLRPTSFHEHVRSIADSWLQFPVGDRFSYASLSHDLAAYLLEVLSGKSFDRFMRNELFRPLGMTSSSFDREWALDHPSLALGHDGDRAVPPVSNPMLGGGGMYSTVTDMAKFVSFELAGGVAGGRRLLSEALLRETEKSSFPEPGEVGWYGLGVISMPYLGATALLHPGDGFGFSTIQMWIPRYGLGVVALTNQGDADLHPLADSAFALMVKAKYGQLPSASPMQLSSKPAANIPLDVVTRLAGTYKPRWGTMRFGVNGGQLAKIAGNDTVPLTPHGGTEFTEPNRFYRFDVTPAGEPIGVRTFSSGGEHWPIMEYWPLNDTPRDRPGVARPEWSQYVADYHGRSGNQDISAQVFLRNGYLYVSAFGGDLKLTPYRPGLFFTADGESVVFDAIRMVLGNRPFVRKPDH